MTFIPKSKARILKRKVSVWLPLEMADAIENEARASSCSLGQVVEDLFETRSSWIADSRQQFELIAEQLGTLERRMALFRDDLATATHALLVRDSPVDSDTAALWIKKHLRGVE